MPSLWNLSNLGALARPSGFSWGNIGLPPPTALGRRPLMDEGTEVGPPPAAEARAETTFEVTGLILILLLVVAAAWILVRKRV